MACSKHFFCSTSGYYYTLGVCILRFDGLATVPCTAADANAQSSLVDLCTQNYFQRTVVSSLPPSHGQLEFTYLLRAEHRTSQDKRSPSLLYPTDTSSVQHMAFFIYYYHPYEKLSRGFSYDFGTHWRKQQNSLTRNSTDRGRILSNVIIEFVPGA